MTDSWDARMDSYIEEAERQIAGLNAEITRLRAENEQLRHQLGELADGDAVRDAAWHYDREERDALKAENERLRAFVQHKSKCSLSFDEPYGPCDCGLQALLDGRGREGA